MNSFSPTPTIEMEYYIIIVGSLMSSLFRRWCQNMATKRAFSYSCAEKWFMWKKGEAKYGNGSDCQCSIKCNICWLSYEDKYSSLYFKVIHLLTRKSFWGNWRSRWSSNSVRQVKFYFGDCFQVNLGTCLSFSRKIKCRISSAADSQVIIQVAVKEMTNKRNLKIVNPVAEESKA